jgi:hypothetical protein
MFAQSKNCRVREQPLIANGSETTSISRQRPQNSGTIFVSRQQIFNKQQFNSKRWMVFSVRSVSRCYNGDGLEQRVQCSVESQLVKRKQRELCEMATNLGVSGLKHWENYKGVCDEKTYLTVSTESEVSPLLKSIARERLVKTENTVCLL